MSWLNSGSDWETFAGLLAPTRGEKILDVGAGNGLVAERVRANSGTEVFAIDPDEKSIAKMRREKPEVKCSTATAESIPFSQGFFDKVYTTMAVHHFADLDRAIEEFARVLKPTGSLVVMDVDPTRGWGRFMAFIENALMRRRLKFFEESQVVEKLRASGKFEVRETDSSARKGRGYFVLCMRKPAG